MNKAQPTILIGQDYWYLIITREIRGSHQKLPVASCTLLGWVLHGPTNCINKPNSSSLCLMESNTLMPEKKIIGEIEVIEQMIKDYFSIDSLGVLAINKINKGEEKAKQILQKTSRRVGNFWETGLLWKNNDSQPFDGKIVAEIRLKTLERKLDSNPQYALEYCKQMERIITNYAKSVPSKLKAKRVWYVPHFGIKNPNKPDKNLRIVFDCASKTQGISYNDQMLAGPDLLKSLLGVLMRFRQRPIGIKGDIVDMFLRIKVREEDQHAQRFLWREMDRKNPPKEYMMSSLIFGSKLAPCSAIYIKNKNATEFVDVMPSAASAIIDNSYMDDFIHSVDSDTEAINIINQVSEINSNAGFQMHEWSSNSSKVLSFIKQNNAEQTVNLTLNNLKSKAEKVLGLHWDTKSDTFTFNLGLDKIPSKLLKESKAPTKREFLKIIMSIFDPLGFLSPFTIKSKILMQEVWISGISWDAPLRKEEKEIWNSWLTELMQINTCSVPRCYTNSNKNLKRCELHVFCDAGKRAYAAVAYWRLELQEGIYTNIIASKSRVAPVKPLSIPRLELQAALLGSRLAQTIEKEHNFKIDERIMWSDSRTVILWVKSNPRFYNTFVAHRLGEISELTSPSEWRWVPTNENPADDATKYTNTPLNSNQRWFFGPSFLKKEKLEWPDQAVVNTDDIINSVNCKKKNCQFTAIVRHNNTCIPDALRFSSYKRLLGSTAQILLAIDKMKGHKNQTLSLQHLQMAEKLILKESQNLSFSDEIRDIQR
ncbi:uncharacterized protein LOC122508900 [Leptopilina heterotoma]|uniref:uncharacterized protein LOC122508900 n=1 Tax=Leptopilina heterotoma TaxID=63436 RepID=UPI001CA85AF3|nr:uncharacterized protein LOC122508900 [Leptopilina heterotoma]